MPATNQPLFGPRVGLWLVTVLGLLICGTIGFMVAGDAVSTVIGIATVALALAWLTTAKQRWWLLVPAAGTLGGYFWFGFKLYPHEVALAGSLAPIIIMTRGAPEPD